MDHIVSSEGFSVSEKPERREVAAAKKRSDLRRRKPEEITER